MIIKVVRNVHSCDECPNLRRVPHTSIHPGSVNYVCTAAMRVLGNSDSMASRMKVKKKVSEICPFKDDAVNQRPRRER